MDYQAKYQEKLTTAKEAVKVVKSGDWVDYSFCANHPVDLDKALAERMKEDSSLRDLKFRGGIALWQPEVTKLEDAPGRLIWNSIHTTGIERKLINSGICYYVPIRYSEVPRYYRENIKHVDVAFIQVAPMDKHGFFNFGLSASHLAALCEISDTVVVEVNENMPVCLGGFEVGVHIDDVDMVVESSNRPMAEMPSGKTSEIDEAVAELIVPEIPDGACLQLGIGGMPNAVGSLIAKSDLKDLGVHTEMYVDSFVDITMAGKITGNRKSIDKGRQVFTFGAGTQKLYDFVDANPSIMAAPVDYVNDIDVIASLDNFISINNTVEVDLFGQVASETGGTRHISGAGGQLDFVLGAYKSKGGKSFICCSSTVPTKDGSLKSRIKPCITEGGIITATRANTQYLVTEYGLVNLKGASTWERAEKIISISHPDLRDELIKEADEMHIWNRTNKRV